jgi:topoisomerase IA-like protein
MKVLRFFIALFKYLLWGEEVTEEEKHSRLAVCETCEFREGKRCGKCGCYLEKKASWSSESCPENKW